MKFVAGMLGNVQEEKRLYGWMAEVGGGLIVGGGWWRRREWEIRVNEKGRMGMVSVVGG